MSRFESLPAAYLLFNSGLVTRTWNLILKMEIIVCLSLRVVVQISGDKTVKGFGRVHIEEGLGTVSYCFHFIFTHFSPTVLFLTLCRRVCSLCSFLKLFYYFLPLFFWALLVYFLSSLLSCHFFLEILFLSVSPYFREDCFLSFLGFHSEASVPYSFHVVASLAQPWFLGRFCLLCSVVTSFLNICRTL